MLTRLKEEKADKPFVLIMNKVSIWMNGSHFFEIDKVDDKEKLKALREEFNSLCKFDEHFLTSALRYKGLSDLQVYYLFVNLTCVGLSTE
jgi:hypothetical protein